MCYHTLMPHQNIVAPKAAIFDLDGTLIDSIADIADCANQVLSENGVMPLPVERYREVVGLGFSSLITQLLPAAELTPERIDSLTRRYRALYAECWNHKTVVYDGVYELLEFLTKRGVILNVLSNKRDDFTKLCVKHFFPDVRFAEVRGEQVGVPLKPAPDAALDIARVCNATPEQCIFVGDSEVDIETAKRADMFSIGVLWGFRSQEIIEAAGATILVAHPTEIIEKM